METNITYWRAGKQSEQPALLPLFWFHPVQVFLPVWYFNWHAGRWAGKSNSRLQQQHGDFDTSFLTPSRFVLSHSSLSCHLESLNPSLLPSPLLWTSPLLSLLFLFMPLLFSSQGTSPRRTPVLLQPLLLSSHLAIARCLPPPLPALHSFDYHPSAYLMHFFAPSFLHVSPPSPSCSSLFISIYIFLLCSCHKHLSSFCHITCWSEEIIVWTTICQS